MAAARLNFTPFQEALLEAMRCSHANYETLIKSQPTTIQERTGKCTMGYNEEGSPRSHYEYEEVANPMIQKIEGRFRAQIAAMQALIPVAINPTLKERAEIASMLRLRKIQIQTLVEPHMAGELSNIVMGYLGDEDITIEKSFGTASLDDFFPEETVLDLKGIIQRTELLMIKATLERRETTERVAPNIRA
jgi:hypothetical protein